MKMEDSANPPAAGAPSWPNTDEDMERLSAAALPLYRALLRLLRCMGYDSRPATSIAVMDAFAALKDARYGISLPPRGGETK
jgi:hypothetical protein